MYKALKAIQRSYQRAQLKHFVLSQKQHNNFAPTNPVPNRAVSMQHNIKKGLK
jgi:hypothetical protein